MIELPELQEATVRKTADIAARAIALPIFNAPPVDWLPRALVCARRATFIPDGASIKEASEGLGVIQGRVVFFYVQNMLQKVPDPQAYQRQLDTAATALACQCCFYTSPSAGSIPFGNQEEASRVRLKSVFSRAATRYALMFCVDWLQTTQPLDFRRKIRNCREKRRQGVYEIDTILVTAQEDYPF